MKLVAAVGVVFLVGGSVIAQDKKPTVERGQALFEAQKCAVCHSVAGKGNQKGPIDAVGLKLTAEELRQWLINPQEMSVKVKATRKPPMPSYAKLPKEDVESLIAYMLTLKKKE